MLKIYLRLGLRTLTVANGSPRLGKFDIGLIFKAGRKNPTVEALAKHVKEGLQSSRFSIAAE